MSGTAPTAIGSGAPRTRAAGFELKLEQGRAVVRLGDQLFLPGVRLADLQLEVPGVRFPFDVAAGAGQFRQHLCDLSRLELHVDAAGVSALLGRVPLGGTGLAGLELGLRSGFGELGGRLEGGPAFTLKVGAEPEGEAGLRLFAYAPRLYGAGPLAEPQLGFPLARAAASQGQVAAASLGLQPLSAALRRLLPPRGWKLPKVAGARLAQAAFEQGRLRLLWDRGGVPPEPPADPEWLEALEGGRGFAAAEALLEQGDLDGAREAYLALGASAADHPFAAARLLGLCSADERFHDEALDLGDAWLARRPDFPPALACQARIRAARGETGRAAELWAQLARGAARRGEELSAIAAADACLALGTAGKASAAAQAIEVALSLRRDHLPALRALLGLGERGGDRETLLRACRRLAAYSTDDAEKAAAHATLGRLLLRVDPPSARLHLDHALRLAPGQPETAETLAGACEEAGEPLRAVKAWDRARDLRFKAGDRAGAARAAAAVGLLWEKKLLQPENALLRYRDAADLDPGPEAHERAGALALSLGHWAEAADRYAAVLGCTDATAAGAAARSARAHRELAGIAEGRLADPARAADHLEKALGFEPGDTAALVRLDDLYRRLGQPAGRISALDRLAALTPEVPARLPLLAEAARLAATPADARRRWEGLLELSPGDAEAWRAVADAALALGDDAGERDALSRLAQLPMPSRDTAAVLDRLSAAWENAGGLPAALEAASEARRLLPTPPRLAAEVSLAGRLGGRQLADVHAEQAESLSGTDPAAAAASWLARARLLAGSDVDLALAALAEARLLVPADAEVLEAQAHLAESHGDLSLALEALGELAEQRPEDGRLASRMARAALTAGDRELAREEAQRAVDLGAHGAEALREEVLTRLADPDAAAMAAEAALRAAPAERLSLLRRALELDPASLPALQGLAAADLADLAGPERLDWLARLANHPEASSVEAARALTARADALAAAGDATGALAAARQAAEREPGDALALERVAALAAGVDDAAAAEALLARAALAQERGEQDAALRLAAAGQAALSAGRADGARWALRQALQGGLDREDAAAAWQALASQSRAAGDPAAEREALLALVPLLPTGEKPAALLRLGALQAAAGEAPAARETVELARRLSPRDPEAVEAALAAAERDHDLAAAAERLGELAELSPATAGPRLLAQARLLFGPLARPEEADDAFSRAAALLPPDPALAEEQVGLRRAAPAPVGDRPWGEPLEKLAARLSDREGALALRQAAEVALGQGDMGSALRAARRAFERSADEPALAGPLLARLLYRQGSRTEALAVLRRLLDEATPQLSERALARVCRALAEVAEDAGELETARRALATLVERRPHDTDAALGLFRLEPDRRRAVNELVERTNGWRSTRARTRALARAAATARTQLADPALADALWRRARAAAASPALMVEVEDLRAESARADHDPADNLPPAELLEALGDAAEARAAAGETAEALALHEEAADLAVRHGLATEELRQRRHLAGLQPGDARRALQLGQAAGRAGAWDEAADALARAGELDPEGPHGGAALDALPAALRAAGDVGGALAAARRKAERALTQGQAAEREAALHEALALADELGESPEAADALEPLAGALLRAGDPRGDALAERAVDALTASGEGARASALVALAARAQTGARRAAWLRRLAASAQARGDRAAALGALAEAVAAEPGDQALRERYLALLEHAGDPAALARALAGALEQPGVDRGPVLARLARALTAAGDDAGAEAAERETLALGPTAPGWADAEAALERRWREKGDERALAGLDLRRAEAEPSSRGRAQRLARAAEALLRAGAGEEARAAALRASEAEPDAPEPWRVLARAEAAAGHDTDAAAAHLAAALRGDAAEAAAEALEAARLFEAAGRDGDAARACAAAVAALPGSPGARRSLAARAQAAGDLAGAARHLLALDRDLLPGEERAEHDRQLARSLTAAGLPEADEAWAVLFEADAGDAEAFEILATAALAGRDHERWLRLAARHDGALSAGDPARRRDLRCARARLLAELGQVDAAEGAWHAALTIDPEHRPAIAALRELLTRRGDTASAADLAAREALLTRDPLAVARLHLHEARLRRSVNDTARTAEVLEKAIHLAAESPDPEAPAVAAEARLLLDEVSPRLQPLDEEVTVRVAFRPPEVAPGAVEVPVEPVAVEPPVAFPVEAAPAPEPLATGSSPLEEALRAAESSPLTEALQAAAVPPPAEPPAAGEPPLAVPVEAPPALEPSAAETSPLEEALRTAEAPVEPSAAELAPAAALAPAAQPSPAMEAAPSAEPPPAVEIAPSAEAPFGEPSPLAEALRSAELPPPDGESAPAEPPVAAQAAPAVEEAPFADADLLESELDGALKPLDQPPDQPEETTTFVGPRATPPPLPPRLPDTLPGLPLAPAPAQAATPAPIAAAAAAPAVEALPGLREEALPGPGAWAMPAELLQVPHTTLPNLPNVPEDAPVAEQPDGGQTVPEFTPFTPHEPPSEEERRTLGIYAAPKVAPPPGETPAVAPPRDEPPEPPAPVFLDPGSPATLEPMAVEPLEPAAVEPPEASPRAPSLPWPAPAFDPAWESDPSPAAEERIRHFAEAASGAARARALESLARRLERAGDRPGAAAALLSALASSPPEGGVVEPLRAVVALDPANGPATAALARAFLDAGRPAEAAALLAPFEAGAEGLPAREVLGLQLAAARDTGDVTRGVALALRAAGQAQDDAEVLEAASAALVAGGRTREALGLSERAARLLPDPAARAARLAELAGAAEGLGDRPLALWLWEGARAASPRDGAVLGALVRLLSGAGDPLQLAPLARELEDVAGPAAVAPYAAPVGRAFLAAGDPAQGVRWLEEAVARAPSDTALRRELEAAWVTRPETAARALGPALQRVRHDPADVGALVTLAEACAPPAPGLEGTRRVELGRVATSLAAFLDPGRAAPTPFPPLRRITPSLRNRAALPEAAGPSARLISLLAPWLELLFPADLARRGVRPEQRLGAGQAPALEARLAAAANAFGGRVVVPFLADAPGWDTALENTQPPSLILGNRLVRELKDGAVAFAVGRALCLADLGWALVGKFAPADLGVLCELACRFAGGKPPPLGLPPQRAGAFLDALGRYVPATAREGAAALAAGASAELTKLAPRDLQLALRRTAARQALLWTGDLTGALEALAAARRRNGEREPTGGRALLLADPDLADLVAFALSDLYLDLRVEGVAATWG